MNIAKFFENIETEHKISCVRSINVELDTEGRYGEINKKWATLDINKPNPNKPTEPYSCENNKLTPEDILKKKKYPNFYEEQCMKGNTLSLYLKYIPKLYVVDFDTKNINKRVNGCVLYYDFYDRLNKDGVAFTETNKGFHYYIYIDNMIEYTQQQKICINPNIDMDLIKTNNIWETKTREIKGEIKEYDWNDIKKYFNIGKMTNNKITSPPVSPPVSQNNDEEWGVIKNNDFPRCNKEDFIEYLNSIKPRWDDYDTYILIGHICFNNFEGDMDGLKIWDAWCMKSEKYDSKTIQSQWAYFRKQYDNGSNKVSYKKLIEFHILDYPPKNIYEKWYKSNVFMEEMNKICMYYTPTGDILYFSRNNYIRTKINIARSYYKKYTFEIKKEKFNPFDIWLSSIDRKNVDKIVFNPKGECEVDEFNTWKGFNYKNTGEYDNTKIKKWLNHIHNILADGDDDTYEYILNWFAQILQTPHKKNKVCLVLHSSAQGVGKSLILDMIGRIIGHHSYYSTSNLKHILGDFNGDAEGKLLVNLNETNWGGDKKMVGAFKEFITDETIVINRKGKESYTIKNFSNTIITTNEDWIVSIDGNDRRFNIRECKNEKYHKEYYDEIADTPLQDIANFLYNKDITNYDPRNFIKSELHEAQVIKNFNSVESFYDNLLNKEINMNGWELDDEEEIPKSEIYDLYKENLTKNERQVSINAFWKEFKKVCPSVIIKKANKNKKGRMIIPCLIKAHEDWGKYKGL
tara:strand:- start:189 stop:2423 length:2235 start_codon:yes stop_codon:yes gene_type:complete